MTSTNKRQELKVSNTATKKSSKFQWYNSRDNIRTRTFDGTRRKKINR